MKSHENGILIPEGDIAAMSRGIVEMFANEEAYRILARKSLAHIQSLPTWAEQVEKLEKIILEASEQCGQNIVPKLFETMNFPEALEHGKNSEEKVIFHLNENDYDPGGVASGAHRVSIFIGPEGGFTESEIKLSNTQGYTAACGNTKDNPY